MFVIAGSIHFLDNGRGHFTREEWGEVQHTSTPQRTVDGSSVADHTEGKTHGVNVIWRLRSS